MNKTQTLLIAVSAAIPPLANAEQQPPEGLAQ